ncbi:MAG: T9SS type A sorting domain-containing protein [Flavobacteriales bacterium]|nr:T9SS type A sorting domain-containing protein [Flavobacteriales bacterium]
MLRLSNFISKNRALAFWLIQALLVSLTIEAQTPYLQERLCGPGNGKEYVYSIDEVGSNIRITSGTRRISGGAYALCSILIKPDGEILSKDEIFYDSVGVTCGYRDPSIHLGDSIVLAGALKWNQDSVLPAIIGVDLTGKIATPRLINEGFQFGEFYDGVETGDGGMMLFGTVTTDTGYVDFLAVRVNADGEVQWMKTYGTTTWDQGLAICKGPDGGFFLGGETRGYGNGADYNILIIRVDSNGKEIWRGDWGGYYSDWFGNLEYNPNVGLLFTGTKAREQGGSLGPGAYVMLLDEDGEIIWDQFLTDSYGDTSSFSSFRVGRFLENGTIMVAGRGERFDIFSSESKPAAMILDYQGNVLMKRIYTSFVKEESIAWFEDLEQLNDGRIIATGVYIPDNSNAQDTGNQDILIVELDENGCEYPGCQPPLGQENIKATPSISDWKVFPNPAMDVITLSCGLVSNGLTEVRMYNTAGQQVLQQSFSGTNVDVRVAYLATGVYFLEISSVERDEVWRTKLVVR